MKKLLLLSLALLSAPLVLTATMGNPAEANMLSMGTAVGNEGLTSEEMSAENLDTNQDSDIALTSMIPPITEVLSFKIINSKSEFDALLNSSKAVVLKINSDKLIEMPGMSQRDQRMMKKFKDKVVFCKVNIDAIQEFISSYNIRMAPTYIFFKGGKEDSRRPAYIFRLKEYRKRIHRLLK